MNDEVLKNTREIVLKGVGVSPGVAVCPAYIVITEDERYVERDISEDQIPLEIARFEDALIDTRKQIHDIQQIVGGAIGHENASIFDAHLLVVDDRDFVEEVIRCLKNDRRNVETVLKKVTDHYANALSRVEDDYLRERAADVRDVAKRLLRNLSGNKSNDLADAVEPCIVVADDLAPSDTATMNRDIVIGFATDLGGATSHTAIMARALEIPAVVGLHDVSVSVKTGDTLLIDGSKGLVIINPTAERLEHYGQIAVNRKNILAELSSLKNEPARMLCGHEVILSANIELPSEVESVLEHGAYGVGLFRSEFLYLSSEHLPSETEQTVAYEEVAKRVAPDPVIIRTLDLGGDKFLPHLNIPHELNPFMGCRAIRYCLEEPHIFKTQLRAILRASRHGNVKVMYPMICSVEEVIRANSMLEEAKDDLRSQNVEFDENIDVGIMIEIPSAALTANLMAPYVSFFSIGTNDLVQYTMAVDRVNERVANLYQPTHPAILKLIQWTIDVARDSNIWVGVCGEMAGNPLLVPLLLGLGVDELSTSPSLVPFVKKMVRSVRLDQAKELARDVLCSVSGHEVLDNCRRLTEEVAPELLEFVD